MTAKFELKKLIDQIKCFLYSEPVLKPEEVRIRE